MRRAFTLALTGLLSLSGLSLVQGTDLKGRDPRTGKEPLPVKKAAAPEPGATCGSYGTSVEFHSTPSEAAKKALKEEKLVMVLHVSGHFEDPRYT